VSSVSCCSFRAFCLTFKLSLSLYVFSWPAALGMRLKFLLSPALPIVALAKMGRLLPMLLNTFLHFCPRQGGISSLRSSTCAFCDLSSSCLLALFALRSTLNACFYFCLYSGFRLAACGMRFQLVTAYTSIHLM